MGSQHVKRALIWLAAIVVLVFVLPRIPHGDPKTLPDQLVNGLLLGTIYALMALGYTMVYGVLRLINFAHGEVYMLGAYVALFGSYLVGYGPSAQFAAQPTPILAAGTVAAAGIVMLVLGVVMAVAALKVSKIPAFVGAIGWALVVLGLLGFAVGKFQPEALNITLMLLGSMTICALVGIIIERFAYRPMRAHSRIASLITAIGVSLFLQNGGALFLPNSPPPAIVEDVNPYRQAITIHLIPGPAALHQKVAALEPAYQSSKKAFDAYLARTHKGQFDTLDAEGEKLHDDAQTTSSAYNNAKRQEDSAGVSVTVQQSRLIMLVTVCLMMIGLTYLVLFTRSGRAMRAVSHDFDSAALMGVNVDSIVTLTFVIGSSLAGAGAMMIATFQGTPLTTFYGLLPGVKAFVAAVLGGIGNIPGAVLGGILMGMAETVVVWYGYSQYKDAVAFVILIVVLLLRPGGILGSSKVEKV